MIGDYSEKRIEEDRLELIGLRLLLNVPWRKVDVKDLKGTLNQLTSEEEKLLFKESYGDNERAAQSRLAEEVYNRYLRKKG